MVFEFYIGGYLRPVYNLELTGPVLKCKETPEYLNENDEEIIVVEGNPEWQELLKYLTTRKWKKEYSSDVIDGTQWKLRVRGNKININSHGSNSYPPGFKKFLGLLNEVVAETGMHVG